MKNTKYDFTTRFDFGKHKGETLQEVLTEEPGYVAWCLMTTDHFYLTLEALETLIQKRETIPSNEALTAALNEEDEDKAQRILAHRPEKWRKQNAEKRKSNRSSRYRNVPFPNPYDLRTGKNWLAEAAGSDDPEVMRTAYWNID